MFGYGGSFTSAASGSRTQLSSVTGWHTNRYTNTASNGLGTKSVYNDWPQTLRDTAHEGNFALARRSAAAARRLRLAVVLQVGRVRHL